MILVLWNLRSRVSFCCVNRHFNGSFVYGYLRPYGDDDVFKQRIIQSFNRLWGLDVKKSIDCFEFMIGLVVTAFKNASFVNVLRKLQKLVIIIISGHLNK